MKEQMKTNQMNEERTMIAAATTSTYVHTHKKNSNSNATLKKK